MRGINDAGFDLWRAQPANHNFVFSPASIGHAVLMARGAADEATGAAIDEAFGLPSGVSAHEAWNVVGQQIDAAQGEDVTVTMADRIWPALDVEPDQRWVDLLAAEHGADVQKLDLRGDPEGSRKVINGWVSDSTEALIPELLPQGFLQPQQRARAHRRRLLQGPLANRVRQVRPGRGRVHEARRHEGSDDVHAGVGAC